LSNVAPLSLHDALPILVATPSLESELTQHGFGRLARWSRGVDTTLFRPRGNGLVPALDLPRPVWLYVGRVAVEKNIGAFLSLPLDRKSTRLNSSHLVIS